jgi:WD40 repeat protein
MTCVRYSSSGEFLAMANYYNIFIWNPVTKQRIATLPVNASSGSLVWTPDGTRLLSADLNSTTIREWDSSTWKQVGDIWKGSTSGRLALNWNATIVASPTVNNCVRLWGLSDWRTIAIFQHSDTPCCITFSMDGKHILAGGKDRKILKWAVPEHAWPEDAIHQVCLCPFSIHSLSHLLVQRFKTLTT